MALYGAETWTLRREEEKILGAFEMWVWRRMEKISWTDKVKNVEVLERIGEKRQILEVIKNRKRNWIGHWLRRECLLLTALEGLVEGKRGRGRRRYQMVDNIKVEGSYWKMKRLAECRKEWRTTM